MPNGKARLVPVTILFDGEYYDASAYKAAPVPMALESGTVYEGFRTGVSQGLFTVTGALQGNNTWRGSWNLAVGQRDRGRERRGGQEEGSHVEACARAGGRSAGVEAREPESQVAGGCSIRGPCGFPSRLRPLLPHPRRPPLRKPKQIRTGLS